jgi:hypothetical protein
MNAARRRAFQGLAGLPPEPTAPTPTPVIINSPVISEDDLRKSLPGVSATYWNQGGVIDYLAAYNALLAATF